MENKLENKEFREERFEFALYVNDNLICKRNFKINNYIDESMQSLDFKFVTDEIVEMINSDLKSKSRVYTWYYYDETVTDDEFSEPLLEPWECTFKFVISDNKVPLITRIWDGYGYPKAIRDKVDIANKVVKITTKDGQVFTYDKEAYFAANEGRLSPDLYVLKAMIADKPDLLVAITKKICDNCSPREGAYQTTGNYTLSDVYVNKEYELDENGQIKLDENGKRIFKVVGESKKYYFPKSLINNKYISEWSNVVFKKTRKYLSTLY